MLPKPKKSLGQNFLLDKNIQRKIAAACDISDSDTVLEIGPGTGAITGLLARKARQVFAVEIDTALCETLTSGLKTYPNLSIINADILKTDIRRFSAGSGQKIKVVGNIPYYITTPIIERLLEYRDMIRSVYLTVQKEFGQRMAAAPGSKEYGRLSCFVRYYTEPAVLFLIKKNSFTPAPKVDSCFLRLTVRARPAVTVGDEERFFRIIRASFQQRRKTLANSLKGMVSREHLQAFFSRYSIDPRIRPERLSLQDFAHLANIV
jgi:16S rRNA (adenine1518-N6/adenine1519-N6)-dimethyltransferase